MNRPLRQADRSVLRDAEAHFHAGRRDAAAALCDQALARDPDQHPFLHLRAVLAIARGEVAIAESCLRRIIAQAPGDAQAHRNLGAMLAGSGRIDEALPHFEAALSVLPDDPGTLVNYGRALRQGARTADAEAAFDRAHRLEPTRADALHGLGLIAGDRGDSALAITRLEQAAAREPRSALILADLGSAYHVAGRIDDAIDTYRSALAIDPNNDIVLARLAHQLERACAWAAAADYRARLIARSDAAMAAGRRTIELPFAQLAYQDDPAAILRLATAWSAEIAARAGAPLAPAANDRNPDRILRIGYLSHDFRTHAVAQLCHRVFALHDRTSVQAVAYSTGPDDGSPLRRAVVESVDMFRDLRPLSHRQAAETIRADAIDILVDLTGHTSGSRLEIAALRPAPLQASWLGYPGTSGAAFIDWLIADATVIPPGDERFHAEAICRLPDTYLPADDRQPIASTVPSRASQRLPATGFVFCSFNNMHKIEPVMFGIWMDLLRATPGSVLWLHAYNELAATNLRAAAKGHGIDPARLVFADRPDKATHLARASLADLALDTRLYNGHTTTLDMLWAGVPVLTVPGRTFQARVSAGLLRAIGLPALVAPDLDGYRALALDLARDPKKLAALRSKLAANRTTTPLFDTARFTRHLEAACRTIWRQYCAGGRPGDRRPGAGA